MKVTVNAEPAFVVTVFAVPITEKFKLVRSMIKSYVKIKHSVADFKVENHQLKKQFKVCLCPLLFIFVKRKSFKNHEQDFYFI